MSWTTNTWSENQNIQEKQQVSGVYIKIHFSEIYLTLGCLLDEGKANHFRPSTGEQHL